jgi:ornithine cyclodeaminase/alanine dehydrogenase
LVGAGALARTHLEAISTVRQLEQVTVWSRTRATAEGFAAEARGRGHTVQVVDTVQEVAEASDIICTLTPSREPLFRGAWLRPGHHVNAVGAPPRPDHRELDTEAMVRASLVVVDTVDTALAESGDVLIPIAEGAISRDDLGPELGAVLAGTVPGRQHASDITVFNSVGVGIQDLAAVQWLLQQGIIEPGAAGTTRRS